MAELVGLVSGERPACFSESSGPLPDLGAAVAPPHKVPSAQFFGSTRLSHVVSNYTMKTANVADLRNDFQKVAAWISDGESVSIKMRGKLFATLTPAHGLSEPAMPKIDFAAQLKKIWGDKVFTDAEVQEMRAAELEGEEG